jgi:hypothetical protein
MKFNSDQFVEDIIQERVYELKLTRPKYVKLLQQRRVNITVTQLRHLEDFRLKPGVQLYYEMCRAWDLPFEHYFDLL